MNDTTRMGAALAAAAAITFSTSSSASSAPLPDMWSETPTLISCQGGNACRGQSICKTIGNSCQGQNACKGQGWVQILAPTRKEATEQCKKRGGTVVF